MTWPPSYEAAICGASHELRTIVPLEESSRPDAVMRNGAAAAAAREQLAEAADAWADGEPLRQLLDQAAAHMIEACDLFGRGFSVPAMLASDRYIAAMTDAADALDRLQDATSFACVDWAERRAAEEAEAAASAASAAPDEDAAPASTR